MWENPKKFISPHFITHYYTYVIVVVIMASSLLRKLDYFKWFDNTINLLFSHTAQDLVH